MGNEKNFEEKVKKFLKEQNCWFIKYWGGGGYTKSGIPDLLVCCSGLFLGVELKAPKGKPSELQLYHLKEIGKAGGIGILLYPNCFEQFKVFIEQIKTGTLPATFHDVYPFLRNWETINIKNKGEKEMPTKKKVDEQLKENMEFNYPDIIREKLMSTGREGVIDLLGYMQEIGFLTAACSGGNHLCCEGGLAKHSVNVMWMAEKIAAALFDNEEYKEIHNSVIIAALLHDLGKCGDFGKRMYVDNILKSGKPSTAKPFKRNPELSAVPHAVRSIKLATLFIDLTEEEEWAILCHDGLYDFMKYEMQGHETPLSMIIHWADMWASKVIEKSEEESEE